MKTQILTSRQLGELQRFSKGLRHQRCNCCDTLQGGTAGISGAASSPGTDLGIWYTQCQSKHNSLCLVIHYIQFASGT